MNDYEARLIFAARQADLERRAEIGRLVREAEAQQSDDRDRSWWTRVIDRFAPDRRRPLRAGARPVDSRRRPAAAGGAR